MSRPSFNDYMQLLEKNPALCAHGMAGNVQKNYQANRKSLEASFEAFLICCDWFSQQKESLQDEISFRSSLELKHEIEFRNGQFIPHGTVLAAAIFLDIGLNADICQRRTNLSATHK